MAVAAEPNATTGGRGRNSVSWKTGPRRRRGSPRSSRRHSLPRLPRKVRLWSLTSLLSRKVNLSSQNPPREKNSRRGASCRTELGAGGRGCAMACRARPARSGKVLPAILTKRKLDGAMLDDLEDVLIRADLGVATAARIAKAIGYGRHEKGYRRRRGQGGPRRRSRARASPLCPAAGDRYRPSNLSSSSWSG